MRLENFASLETLEVCNSPIKMYQHGVQVIENFRNLKTLKLEDCEIGAGVTLKNFSLSKLILKNVGFLFPPNYFRVFSLFFPKKFQRIINLYIQEKNQILDFPAGLKKLTKSGYIAIESFSELQCHYLEDYTVFPDPMSLFIKNLEYICFHIRDFKEEMNTVFENLPLLKHLYIEEFAGKNASSKILKGISHLKNLTHLSLSPSSFL